MQIEKALVNDRLSVSDVSWNNYPFQLFIILQIFTRETCYFLKK